MTEIDGEREQQPEVRQSSARRARFLWGRRGAGLLIFIAVVEYLVIPQLVGTRDAVDLLGSLRPAWVVLGVVLEVLSLLSYSRLTRTVLPERPPTFSWLLRTDLTALGVSHVVPGGTATATALRYSLLREGGTSAEDAVVGAAVQAVGSALVLIALLWSALICSVAFIGVHAAYVGAAAAGAAVIVGAVATVLALSRGSARTGAAVDRLVGRLPVRFRNRARRGLDRAVGQVYQLLADRRSLRRSAMWAISNWLFDAASLWVFLAAFGWYADPVTLLIGYGLANVVGAIPLSPGGLGMIEGVLIPSLVGFGAPSAIALLGVVSWRLFEFWVPIPVAGFCYLSLRTQNWRDHHGLRRAWTELASVPRQRHHRPVALPIDRRTG